MCLLVPSLVHAHNHPKFHVHFLTDAEFNKLLSVCDDYLPPRVEFTATQESMMSTHKKVCADKLKIEKQKLNTKSSTIK